MKNNDFFLESAYDSKAHECENAIKYVIKNVIKINFFYQNCN